MSSGNKHGMEMGPLDGARNDIQALDTKKNNHNTPLFFPSDLSFTFSSSLYSSSQANKRIHLHLVIQPVDVSSCLPDTPFTCTFSHHWLPE
ncbi:hypothetical protein LY78DRAFT_653274 [Colletotrichum sublineola]|nr:hypothetical protein LY78DRAFT_653274 [Colletotrichum sublineola]